MKKASPKKLVTLSGPERRAVLDFKQATGATCLSTESGLNIKLPKKSDAGVSELVAEVYFPDIRNNDPLYAFLVPENDVIKKSATLTGLLSQLKTHLDGTPTNNGPDSSGYWR